MSQIEISKAFTMPREELRGELDKLATQLAGQLDLNCEWQSDDCLDFRRNGAEGRINISDDELELTVKLGMLMNVFRSTIEDEVKSFLNEHVY